MNIKKKLKRAFLLIGPFLFHLVLSQEGNLKHFERKNILNELILPKDSFREMAYKIPFPKEIYNSGEIVLKQAILQSVKLQSVDLEFKNYIYKEVVYCFKKKNEILFDALFKKENANVLQPKIIYRGGKICYNFSLDQTNEFSL